MSDKRFRKLPGKLFGFDVYLDEDIPAYEIRLVSSQQEVRLVNIGQEVPNE